MEWSKDLEKYMAEHGHAEKTLPSQLAKNHLLGWKQPGDDYTLHPQTDKEFPYDLSYRDEKGKKYFRKGKVMAPDAETARIIASHYVKEVLGMKKIWCCIFVKKKMEILDGNGM